LQERSLWSLLNASLFVDLCFQLKKLIGEITTDLDFYGNVSEHDPERLKAAAECFWRRASELRGSLNAILFYEYFSNLIGLPTEKEEIIAASRARIGHSTFLFEKLNPPDPRFARTVAEARSKSF
jgi:hypothetical protein